MGAYTILSASTKATHLQLIATVNSNLARIAAVLNNGIDGGSTANNIKSATVQRVNMHAGASVGRFTGDIFSTNAHVRKGGTVTKSSGRVFNVAAGRWYVLDGTVTPQEIRQVFNTAATTDSVLANRKTYLNMGFDGVIDKNDVAHGANAPTLAAGHLRFAYLSASASIVPTGIVMLGNSTYAANTVYPDQFRQDIQVHAGSSTASAARYLIIRAGTKARSAQNNKNLNITSDIIIDRNINGAGGTNGSYTASTAYFLHLLGDVAGARTLTGILHTSTSAPAISGYDATAWIASRVTGASGHLYPVDTTGDENFLRRQRNMGTSDLTGWDTYNPTTSLKLKAGRVTRALVTFGGTSADPSGAEFIGVGMANPISGSSPYKVYMNATGLTYSSFPPVWVTMPNRQSFKAKALGAATITVILRGYKERTG